MAPYGLALGPDGTFYVADYVPNSSTAAGHSYILKVDANGVASYFVGNCPGYIDGGPGEALFGQIFDLAIDDSGNVIVPDYTNSHIRRVTPAGQVTTIAVAGNPNLGPIDVYTEPLGKIYFMSRSSPPGVRLLQ